MPTVSVPYIFRVGQTRSACGSAETASARVNRTPRKRRVFSKQFAYRDTEKGLEGLLKDKGIFVIMNAGWVGMGRGSVGDGIPQKAGEKSNPIWDSYMTAYKTVWDDTAGFWGVKNLGQFVNDRTPGNLDADYAEKLQKLRNDLKASLDRNFGLK